MASKLKVKLKKDTITGIDPKIVLLATALGLSKDDHERLQKALKETGLSLVTDEEKSSSDMADIAHPIATEIKDYVIQSVNSCPEDGTIESAVYSTKDLKEVIDEITVNTDEMQWSAATVDHNGVFEFSIGWWSGRGSMKKVTVHNLQPDDIKKLNIILKNMGIDEIKINVNEK